MIKSVTLRRVALFALASFFFCHEFAAAQDYRGKIQGIVEDPAEAALAQASVTLRNINTGIETVRQHRWRGPTTCSISLSRATIPLPSPLWLSEIHPGKSHRTHAR